MQKLHKNTSWRKNVREANKKKSQDPKWRRNHRAAMQILMEKPEWRKRQKEGAQRRSQTSEWRKNNNEAQLRTYREGRIPASGAGKGKGGWFDSQKNGVQVRYDSTLELAWYKRLEDMKNVRSYTRGPRVPYSWNGGAHSYFVDLWVLFKKGRLEVWEVKPLGNHPLPDGSTNRGAKDQAKWNAARKWCGERGIIFRVVSGEDLE